MTVPEFRLPLEPSRSVRVTVPCVVGFQVKVVGCPALRRYPPAGILNGFDPSVFCAEMVAMNAERTRANEKRILDV